MRKNNFFFSTVKSEKGKSRELEVHSFHCKDREKMRRWKLLPDSIIRWRATEKPVMYFLLKVICPLNPSAAGKQSTSIFSSNACCSCKNRIFLFSSGAWISRRGSVDQNRCNWSNSVSPAGPRTAGTLCNLYIMQQVRKVNFFFVD